MFCASKFGKSKIAIIYKDYATKTLIELYLVDMAKMKFYLRDNKNNLVLPWKMQGKIVDET